MHKTIKINRKGMDAKELVLWALATLFLVLVSMFLIKALSSHDKSLKEVLGTGDFDGDNRNPANMYATDLVDPCPCGAENKPQLDTNTQKEYCVLPPAICSDYNTRAETAYKKATGKKTVRDPFFFLSSDNTKCLYSREGCKYYIMYSEE